MSRSKAAKGRPDTIAFRLNDDLYAQFYGYMDTNGFASTSEALREILTIFFASNPIDGAVVAARYNAIMQAKHWILTRMAVNLHELQQEVTQQVISIENSGYGK